MFSYYISERFCLKVFIYNALQGVLISSNIKNIQKFVYNTIFVHFYITENYRYEQIEPTNKP